MKHCFEATTVAELKERTSRMTPTVERRWGRMNAAQAMAHCAGAFQMASGEILPPRKLAGHLLGWAVKPLVFRDDAPMRPNSPTVDALIVQDERDFTTERARLLAAIDRFAAAGPGGCTSHPHAFFGRLTPDEWSILMYKHLDHHLRQFGV